MSKGEGFKVNDYVVYPLHGVGLIKEVYARQNTDPQQLYYRIQLKESGMTISIPKEKATCMGLRSIVDKKEIQNILFSLSKHPSRTEDNWKLRFQNNTDKLKTGNIHEVIHVIKELFLRNKVKPLSIMERKQYENAYRMLVKELSLSGEIEEEEIHTLIANKLDTLVLSEQSS